MPRKKKRSYTAEQKADAVRLAQEYGNVSKAGRDLGIHPNTIRAWVLQAETDDGRGPDGALTTDEKEELRRLRRENRTLLMERDFLKKAAAFFAKEEGRHTT